MQDTILNWLMMYSIAAAGTFYIADDIRWIARLALSILWPLTLIITVVMLIVTLIKN